MFGIFSRKPAPATLLNVHGSVLATGETVRQALESALKSGVCLWAVQLPNQDLSDINLSNKNLFKANLSNTNLSNANLSGAYLERANLTGANLYGVDLRSAFLAGAGLSGAKLLDVNFNISDRTIVSEVLYRRAGNNPYWLALTTRISKMNNLQYYEFLTVKNLDQQWVVKVLEDYVEFQ